MRCSLEARPAAGARNYPARLPSDTRRLQSARRPGSAAPRRHVHVARTAHGADRRGFSGSSSILRRSRAMRMSMERSNGSHSRLRVSVSSRSRDSTWFGMLDEGLQQVELHRRERRSRGPRRRAAAAPRGRARSGRSRCAGSRPARRGGGAAALLHAAHHALEARAQLARVERLGDVVVGADLEADDAVDDVAGAGDHDDADVVALAQVAREREAVLAGQARRRAARRRARRARSAARIAAPLVGRVGRRSRARRGTRPASRGSSASSSTIRTAPCLMRSLRAGTVD